MDFVCILQSVEGIISASKEDLVLCPGLGPQKVSKDTRECHEYAVRMEHFLNNHVDMLCLQARRLHDVLHKPFLKSKTKNTWHLVIVLNSVQKHKQMLL